MRLAITLLAVVTLGGCASVVSKITDRHPNEKAVDIPYLPASESGKGIKGNGYFHQTADKDRVPNGRVAWRYMTTVKRGNGPFRGNRAKVYTKDGKLIALIEPRLNPNILGNIFYGGPLGVIADFAIGGAYSPTVVPVRQDLPIGE